MGAAPAMKRRALLSSRHVACHRAGARGACSARVPPIPYPRSRCKRRGEARAVADEHEDEREAIEMEASSSRGTASSLPQRRGNGNSGSSGYTPYTRAHFDLGSMPTGFLSLARMLELSGMGLNVLKFSPGQGYSFTHTHAEREEVYICAQGRAQMQLDGELVDVRAGDAVRVSPETKRSVMAVPGDSTGYALHCKPTDLVMYVVSGVPTGSIHGDSIDQDVRTSLDDTLPDFDDVPLWFQSGDLAAIRRQNAELREKFLRDREIRRGRQLDAMKRRGGLSGSEPQAAAAHMMQDYSSDAPLAPGQEVPPARLSEGAVCACCVLVDSRRRVMLVRPSSADAGANGRAWDLPSVACDLGMGAGGRRIEEQVARHLRDSLGAHTHPEALEPATFCPSEQGSGISLVFVCRDWHLDVDQGEGGGLDASGLEAWWVPASQVARMGKGGGGAVEGNVSSVVQRVGPMLKQMLKQAPKPTNA